MFYVFILGTGVSMMDNISFVDLVSLMRITPDATVERFGSLINSSFFDASNILGTLKQKALVDFVTQFPSQSAITVTEQGKQLIADAGQKATEPVDKLDAELLKKISEGSKTLPAIAENVNITPKDMAFHLYKLSVQQFLSYELRNGSVDIKLTEKGFLAVKEGIPAAIQSEGAQQAQESPTVAQQDNVQSSTPAGQPDTNTPTQPKTDEELKAIEAKIMREKRTDKLILAAIVIVIAVIVLYLYIVGII